MQKTAAIVIFSLLTLSFSFLSAQIGNWCSSDYRLQQQINSNPQKWQEFVSSAQNPKGARALNETVYIPVVFHIVYDTDNIGVGENITDAQAISQIDAMNLYFNYGDPDISKVPAPFQSLVGNCNIRFCLAQFDENGQPTIGVIRHAYPTIATWDTENDIDNTLKPATIWDPSSYLNIWSVRMGGQLTADGILGYSSFPGFGPANADGIVARYTNIGTTNSVPVAYRKGKTITHEVGHWLGLLHTWGFDDNCGDVGDLISDTPDQAGANFGCPSFPHVSCSGSAPNGDMFMNYMDYTNDTCSSMFTIGQAERMHQTLDGVRSSIKNSISSCYYNIDAALLRVTLPSDTVCSLNFKPVVTLKNAGVITLTSGTFYLRIDGGAVQIINWNGSLNIQQQAEITLPEQTVSEGTHTFEITFGDVNGLANDNFSGNDSKTISFYAYDGGGAGTAIPFSEGFETSFPATGWSIVNPNFDLTWVQNVNAGGFGNSYNSASISNLSNFNLRKDGLVTDVYDLTSVTYPELKFDVAYARFNATRFDSLIVYYSLDCGNSWTKIWNQSGAQLATAPDQTASFTPTYSQWKTVSVPLTFLNAQNKVSFKFENVSGRGNVLYIDNVNIQNNPALSVTEISKQDIKVFPNPAGNMAAVRLPANHPFKQMQLINSMGEMVYETDIAGNSLIFSVADFANGLYFIRFTGKSSLQIEKLLISK